jgi:hypothetical protein
VFAAMAHKGTNDWKDHGWWIMAEEAEMSMLWITSHAVVEGRQWSALGKVFGQILSITSSGIDSQIFSVIYNVILYKIKYFVVVPYRVQRIQYRVYDFVAHRWNGSTLAMYEPS